MALDDVKEIKKTVDADCETFMKEVEEIRNHLNNAKEESQALESKLSDSFKRVKKMFFFDDRQRGLFLPRNPSCHLEADAVSQLDHRLIETWAREAEEKERKVPIIVDLLRMIRRELEGLGKRQRKKQMRC